MSQTILDSLDAAHRALVQRAWDRRNDRATRELLERQSARIDAAKSAAKRRP